MILVYCVVVVAILALIVLAIWFSFSVKFNFCVKAKKVVRKKERVRRSERKLVYMTSVTGETYAEVMLITTPVQVFSKSSTPNYTKFERVTLSSWNMLLQGVSVYSKS